MSGFLLFCFILFLFLFCAFLLVVSLWSYLKGESLPRKSAQSTPILELPLKVFSQITLVREFLTSPGMCVAIRVPLCMRCSMSVTLGSGRHWPSYMQTSSSLTLLRKPTSFGYCSTSMTLRCLWCFNVSVCTSRKYKYNRPYLTPSLRVGLAINSKSLCVPVSVVRLIPSHFSL